MEIEIREKKYKFKRFLAKEKQEYLERYAEIKKSFKEDGFSSASELNRFRLNNLFNFLEPQMTKEEFDTLYDDETTPLMNKLDMYINGVEEEDLKKK